MMQKVIRVFLALAGVLSGMALGWGYTETSSIIFLTAATVLIAIHFFPYLRWLFKKDFEAAMLAALREPVKERRT